MDDGSNPDIEMGSKCGQWEKLGYMGKQLGGLGLGFGLGLELGIKDGLRNGGNGGRSER